MLVGTCTLLAVMLFAGFFIFSSSKDAQISLYAVYFGDGVSGLSIGNSVLFNGVQVGTVKEIALSEKDQSQVRVVLEISSAVIIRQDCKATLKVQGITGMNAIYITGGSAASPPLDLSSDSRGDRGDPLPIIPTGKSALEDVASSIPEMITSATRLMNRASELFTPENAENLSLIMESIAKISTDLEEEGRPILANLKASSEHLNRLLADADQVMGKDVRTTLLSIQGSFDQLNQLIAKMEPELFRISGSGAGSLSQLLNDTRNLVRNLDKMVRDLNANPRNFIFGPGIPEYQPNLR
ncbi:MlaD family protein [Desulfosarcina sp. OttesenSCG-928-A07]|nr:MlaD family protein [Desulfosarcina sp. OttesenSCG-928-A07]